MIDWIIDRRHCQLTWQKKAVTAHAALKKAISQSENDAELENVLAEYGLDNTEGMGAYFYFWVSIAFPSHLCDKE